jgi:N-acetylated-alpha-linked acidic dipeptidase
VIGSTEWAETHAQDLERKAVLYVNSDNIDRGFVRAEGSPSVQALYDSVVADVPDPEQKISLEQRAIARLGVAAASASASPEIRSAARAATGGDLPMSAPGSGSDYEVFVHHLGIASIDVSFGGEGQSGGVYHSAYDTFEHYDRFGDPGFAYGVALAKTAGRVVLRAADAPLAPFRFADVASTIAAQTEDLKSLVRSETEHDQRLASLVEAKAYALAADPTESWGNPETQAPAPDLDFGPLEAAIARLKASAAAFDAAAQHPAADARLDEVNTLLQGAEQALAPTQGLPGRPWYRNLAYAPGVYTGYGTKTLPAIREPIEQRRWADAAAGIPLTAAAIDHLANRLDEASRLLAH